MCFPALRNTPPALEGFPSRVMTLRAKLRAGLAVLETGLSAHNFAHDVSNRLLYSLSSISLLAAIPRLNGFALSRR